MSCGLVPSVVPSFRIDGLPWIEVQPLRDSTLLPAVVDLGAGEAEAIALALSYPGSLLILDDDLGRKIARIGGLRYTGTLGVLVKAKQSGFKPQVAPVVEALQQTNMWLGRELIRMVLREAGEL
jgi:predicted nucleic acid-binding protein